ncbi:MAG: hypothetical protein GMKNLPBB_02931 [Myxococcota bacterium]|nr:hypothetical protein [Myxococcota bacterium]
MHPAAAQIRAGDIRAAARLMRDLDDGVPGAQDILKDLFPFTGRAWIIGVTGNPGSGKSTLVDQLIGTFRAQGKRVGVVAIDPSSPFSGGAILGDRIRMQRHSGDDGVFIRSLATRGHLGGLSASTVDVASVLDAMGFDIIFIETVGVGQDEIEVVYAADTAIVVCIPGAGDDVQSIKAGILEIADLFVVNKADREGAQRLVRDLQMLLSLAPQPEDAWPPRIHETVAVEGKGVDDLMSSLQTHRDWIQAHGADRRRAKMEWRFWSIFRRTLLEEARVESRLRQRMPSLLDDLLARRRDPHTLAREEVRALFHPAPRLSPDLSEP